MKKRKRWLFFLIMIFETTMILNGCASRTAVHVTPDTDRGYFLGIVLKRKTDGLTISSLKIKVINTPEDLAKIKEISQRRFDVRYDIKDKKWYFVSMEPPALDYNGRSLQPGDVYRFFYYDRGFFPQEDEIFIESRN